MRRGTLTATAAGLLLVSGGAAQAGSSPGRFGDDQNTTDAGYHAALDPATNDLTHLKVVRTIPTAREVNATPVASDGLVFFGDYGGTFYVADPAKGTRLVAYDAGQPLGFDRSLWGTFTGVQSTAVVGDVTLPGGREDRRVYFGVNLSPGTFHCLSVSRILADYAAGALGVPPDPTTGDPGNLNDDGTSYVCETPEGAEDLWPMDLGAPAPPTPNVLPDVPPSPEDQNVEFGSNGTFQGSPMLRKDQWIQVGTEGYGDPVLARRDVLYTPSTGIDCSNGELYAIDAFTGERYWTFDPVVNGDGRGGVVWTRPAMSTDGTSLFVTTGNCVQKPQSGELAESLVALDAATGTILWAHQRRLVDTADLDIGNSPTVVDVPDSDDAPGCRNVVSIDKDGCIYGFSQAVDIPGVTAPGFDPLRPGQQRLLWRRCFVTGSLNGGFNAQGASFHGRSVFAQASALLGRAPGDDASTFSIDACTGDLRWASSSIGTGRGEGAIASGVFFQPAGSRLHAAMADVGVDGVPTLLATVTLSTNATQGGGGPSIADGRIHVPTLGGVDVIEIAPVAPGGEPPSPPRFSGANAFDGPYPVPLSPGPGQPRVDPDDPYPAFLPGVGVPGAGANP